MVYKLFGAKTKSLLKNKYEKNLRWVKVIVKMDAKGRIKLPKEVWKKYQDGQKFTMEVVGKNIILKPIKKITVELDDGTVVEADI